MRKKGELNLPNSIDASRRTLLLGSVAISGLGATGCCLAPVKPTIVASCSTNNSSFLAGPEVRAAWAKPQRYFDAHTHFFNARDVPVAGFLSKSVAHSIKNPKIRELVIALAPIAEALSKLAPTPKLEFDDLCSAPSLKALSLQDANDALDREIEQRRDRTAEELYGEIVRRSERIPALVNGATSDAKARGPNALRNQATSFSKDFVVEALRDGGALRDRDTNRLVPQRISELSTEEALVASIKGALQFVGFMLAPRHHNLRTYIKRNAQHSPNLPLSGCFAAMVDLNYWLDCPAKSSHMEDQVRLHEQLALLSQGFMLPLVGYNPWVDIKERKASLDLVERAVKKHGCVGVKIYPPMGFHPFNNAGMPIETSEKRPDLIELDERLASLYELCDSLGVPVMAHANESNGRDASHDALGGVAGWKALRDGEGTVKANIKSLFVNAGHFGGAEVHPDGDWSDEFVKLMRVSGRLNVFSDLGYWNELLVGNPEAGQTAADVAKKLQRELSTSLPDGGTVADRVMFGSDWHMLSKEPGWEFYANGVAAVIRDMDPSGAFTNKILGGNALACFGLHKGGRNIDGLANYYTDQGVAGGPGWMVT